jgi:hypothetical protein
MARAALAVNRNPIAAMGFDPRKTVMDIGELFDVEVVRAK